jgi:hypothetical protein
MNEFIFLSVNSRSTKQDVSLDNMKRELFIMIL